MRRLSEIVRNAITNVGCYITFDGLCVGEGDDLFDRARVRAEPDIVEASLPKEVEEYLKEEGVLHLVDKAETFKARLTLRRLSDGKEETFTLTDFFLKSGIYGRLFSEIGFDVAGGPGDTIAWGFHMRPEECRRLTDFLREAGVFFSFDMPPWIEKKELRVKAKPSPKRPRKEASRFLGFG